MSAPSSTLSSCCGAPSLCPAPCTLAQRPPAGDIRPAPRYEERGTLLVLSPPPAPERVESTDMAGHEPRTLPALSHLVPVDLPLSPGAPAPALPAAHCHPHRHGGGRASPPRAAVGPATRWPSLPARQGAMSSRPMEPLMGHTYRGCGDA